MGELSDPNEKIGLSLSALSDWFDTMRIRRGAYGGPVIHWWLCSFIYCGAGANWTYEGLIEAYLELHRKTRNDLWLKRASEAAEYLLSLQMPDGTYRNSFFELNPLQGSSSVHEASADLGLISLASYLESIGDHGGKYLDATLKNAERSLFQRLWDPTVGTFRSTDNILIKSSYVFNMMATVAQVFLRLYQSTQEAKYRKLVSSALSYILRYQRKSPHEILLGSFPQGLRDENAYALYNARILTFLLDAHKILGDEKALRAADLCGLFLKKLGRKGGGFAFFANREGKIYDYPNLVGGMAEVTRALLELRNFSTEHSSFDEKPHVQWLLGFQDSIGGFRTGAGFHYDVKKTDYKDVFHVCGWNDKIFRLLASLFQGHTLKEKIGTEMKETCWIEKTRATFIENDKQVIIQDPSEDQKIIYRWNKGENLGFVDDEYLKYFVRIAPAQSILGYNISDMIRSTVRV